MKNKSEIKTAVLDVVSILGITFILIVIAVLVIIFRDKLINEGNMPGAGIFGLIFLLFVLITAVVIGLIKAKEEIRNLFNLILRQYEEKLLQKFTDRFIETLKKKNAELSEQEMIQRFQAIGIDLTDKS